MKRFAYTLRTKAGERGFTLIETLLATSILIMLLAILLSAFRLGIRSWEKGEAAVDSIAARRAILSRLPKDVGSMFQYSQDSGAGGGGGGALFLAGQKVPSVSLPSPAGPRSGSIIQRTLQGLR